MQISSVIRLFRIIMSGLRIRIFRIIRVIKIIRIVSIIRIFRILSGTSVICASSIFLLIVSFFRLTS